MRRSSLAPTQPVEESTKAIHMLFETSLIKEIEDYRFQNRYPTRVEAIKALIKLGLGKGGGGSKAR